MALKGNLRSLRNLKAAIRALPVTATAKVAAQAAPAMTDLSGSAYDGGRTVYGQARPRGVDGDALGLVKSGATRQAIEFRATGRDIRTAPLPRWTKYLIAKYQVLPNGPLPQGWRERMQSIAAAVIRDTLGEAARK